MNSQCADQDQTSIMPDFSSGTNLLASIALAAAHIEKQQQLEKIEKQKLEQQKFEQHQQQLFPSNVVSEVLDSNEDVTNNTISSIVNGKVTSVTDHDVLCGRGGETNHHPGNVAYRSLVKSHQPLYLQAKRRDKPKIARTIVDTIMVKRGGRFLKRADDNAAEWIEISVKKAREKTSQALRENAPTLRNKESSSNSSNPKDDAIEAEASASSWPSMLVNLSQGPASQEETSPTKDVADNRRVCVTLNTGTKTEETSRVDPCTDSSNLPFRTPSTNHCLPFPLTQGSGIEFQDMSHYSSLYVQKYPHYYSTENDVSCDARPPCQNDVKTCEPESTNQFQRQSSDLEFKSSRDISNQPMPFEPSSWSKSSTTTRQSLESCRLSLASHVNPTKLDTSNSDGYNMPTTTAVLQNVYTEPFLPSSSVSVSSSENGFIDRRGSEEETLTSLSVISSCSLTTNQEQSCTVVPVSPSFSSVSSITLVASPCNLSSVCRGPRLKLLKRRRSHQEQHECSQMQSRDCNKYTYTIPPPPALPFGVSSRNNGACTNETPSEGKATLSFGHDPANSVKRSRISSVSA